MGGYIGNRATAVRDILTSQKDMITRIVGDITPKTLNILEEEIGGILVFVNSTHYDQGEKYGHLYVILGETRMCKILNNKPNFVYDTLVDQGAYNPAVIANASSATNRYQMEAQHYLKNYKYQRYLGIETGTKEIIKYAVGNDALAPLKKQFIKFGEKHHRR